MWFYFFRNTYQLNLSLFAQGWLLLLLALHEAPSGLPPAAVTLPPIAVTSAIVWRTSCQYWPFGLAMCNTVLVLSIHAQTHTDTHKSNLVCAYT